MPQFMDTTPQSITPLPTTQLQSTTQPQSISPLQCITQLQLTNQLQYTTQLPSTNQPPTMPQLSTSQHHTLPQLSTNQLFTPLHITHLLTSQPHTTQSQNMTDQLYTNTDMLLPMTTQRLTLLPMRPVRAMPPMVNTVLLFLMVALKSLPITLPMLTLAMLLTLSTKVLPNTQNTTQLNPLPTTQLQHTNLPHTMPKTAHCLD